MVLSNAGAARLCHDETALLTMLGSLEFVGKKAISAAARLLFLYPQPATRVAGKRGPQGVRHLRRYLLASYPREAPCGLPVSERTSLGGIVRVTARA
jgi:hypothetical protein